MNDSGSGRPIDLLEVAPIAALVVGTDGCVESANEAAEALIDLPRRRVVGARLDALMSPDERPALDLPVAPGAAVSPTRVRLHRPGGGSRPALLGGRVLDDGRTLLTLVDDARERELERRLALAEVELRRVRALESVGRLASGVVHDFNNMLMVIVNQVDAVAADPALPPAMQPGLDDVRRAADRAGRLAGQLRELSGGRPSAPSLVDLNEAVAEAARLVGPTLGASIHLRVRPDPSVGRVRMDPLRLETLLLNLALNARAAMPAGGSLTLATGAMRVGERAPVAMPGLGPGTWARLTVVDEGVGMTAEQALQLFSPGAHRAGQGTLNAREAVAEAGGRLQVRSAPGRGTRFDVVLPMIATAVEPPRPVEAAPQASGAGRRALLVEDEPGVRAVLHRMLTHIGFSVEEVATAEEGLAKEAAGLALLVSDVALPGRSGVELADALCERQPGLRVLLITGHSGGDLGGHAVLRKPFRLQELKEALARVLVVSPEPPPGT